MSKKVFKVRDKVKRAGKEGPLGVVTDVREEVTPASAQHKEKPLLIRVLWDNGTHSFFAPDGLELAEVK